MVNSTTKRQSFERLDQLSRLLDTAFEIPGTNIRMGIDGLIGLLPGIGDFAGILFSSYIILEAARLGAAKTILTRMILNVAIDSLLGSIPVIGDAFDIYFKANRRNVALLRRHMRV